MLASPAPKLDDHNAASDTCSVYLYLSIGIFLAYGSISLMVCFFFYDYPLNFKNTLEYLVDEKVCD